MDMRKLLLLLALSVSTPSVACGFYPPHVFMRFGKLEVKSMDKATLSTKLGADVTAFQLPHHVALFHNGVSLGLFRGKPVGEVESMGIRYALIADGDKVTTVMLV